MHCLRKCGWDSRTRVETVFRDKGLYCSAAPGSSGFVPSRPKFKSSPEKNESDGAVVQTCDVKGRPRKSIMERNP